MQRRAAAIYFAFFLVVGAGAYAFIGVAEQTSEPHYSLSGPVVGNDSTTAIAGTSHHVRIQSADGSVNATVTWTNESAVFTAGLDNGSTTTYQNDSYTVLIANQTDVSTFTLRAQQNASQILAGDPAVRDTPATVDGVDHVVYTNGTIGPPVSEYLPAPETVQFSVGDEYPYQGNTTTVSAVTPSSATLRWVHPAHESVVMTEGSNVSLGNGEQYFGHFPDTSSVQIVPSNEYHQYNETTQLREHFNERKAGLWGIVILSAIAAIILLAAAYLPVRG
ncbi:MAG: hypothetical protein ABEJ89_02785 [Haloarculaceae archaeon]